MTSVRVHLGCDHAGFDLKQQIAEHLRGLGHDVVDHGAHEYQPDDDYPPFCLRAALAVVDDAGSLCIVIGGSGNGEQIAANKVKGVRAVLGWSIETAKLSRQHGDANVLSIGARMHAADEALAFVDASSPRRLVQTYWPAWRGACGRRSPDRLTRTRVWAAGFWISLIFLGFRLCIGSNTCTLAVCCWRRWRPMC